MKRLFDNVISVFVVVIPVDPSSAVSVGRIFDHQYLSGVDYSVDYYEYSRAAGVFDFPIAVVDYNVVPFGTECLFHALDSVARRRCRSGHQGIR